MNFQLPRGRFYRINKPTSEYHGKEVEMIFRGWLLSYFHTGAIVKFVDGAELEIDAEEFIFLEHLPEKDREWLEKRSQEAIGRPERISKLLKERDDARAKLCQSL
jgi:hypothetical protein